MFDVAAVLRSHGIEPRLDGYGAGDTIFSQGEPCDDIVYIVSGWVKLSVIARNGREAILGTLGAGDFCGEACLAGQPLRTGSATALVRSTVVRVPKATMIGVLHQQHGMSDRFIAHVLARNIHIQENLIDQLLNTAEKRLARTLVLLAGVRDTDSSAPIRAKVSQATLAAMVGTTRSRVNLFLKKFKRRGLIEYDAERRLIVHPSLLVSADDSRQMDAGS
jgi:CRP-like cAMP-binding protein